MVVVAAALLLARLAPRPAVGMAHVPPPPTIDAFGDLLWAVERPGAAPVAASPADRLAAFESWTRCRVVLAAYECLAATACTDLLDVDDMRPVLDLRIELLALDARFCAAKLDALVLHNRVFAVAYEALEKEAIHHTFNEWNRVGL